MRTPRIFAVAFAVLVLSGVGPTTSVRAQQIEVEAGGGWALALSEATYTGTVTSVQGNPQGEVAVDLGAGRHLYAVVGYVREIGQAFDLGVRVRAQASRFGGDARDLASGLINCTTGSVDCTVANAVAGRIRALTLEGRIILTSLGRIQPYLLVGLGAVRTTINGNRVEVGSLGTVTFSEIAVTDAGGDVGLGTTVQVGGGVALDAEMRFTGSLPGGKKNAITVLPFSLGLTYTFR